MRMMTSSTDKIKHISQATSAEALVVAVQSGPGEETGQPLRHGEKTTGRLLYSRRVVGEVIIGRTYIRPFGSRLSLQRLGSE